MKISLKLAQVSDFAQQIKTPISFFCELIILFGWAIHHQFVVSVSRLALCLGLYANFWCMLTQVCDRVTSYKQTSLPPLPLLRVFPCRAIKNKRWMMAFVLLIQMFGVTRFSFLLYPGREKKPQSKQSNDAIKRARWFRSQNDRSQQEGRSYVFPRRPDHASLAGLYCSARAKNTSNLLFIYLCLKNGQHMVSFYFSFPQMK